MTKKQSRSPSAPPPLTAMAARKARLEAERAELFKRWKAALEVAQGNITRAAEAMGLSRNRGNKLTRRFELVEWAEGLRKKAMGRSMGPGKKG